jgi:hypothetical protein
MPQFFFLTKNKDLKVKGKTRKKGKLGKTKPCGY